MSLSDALLNDAEDCLLGPAQLQSSHLEDLLTTMSGPGVDYADLYFEHTCTESWSIEEGIVKSGSFHQDKGVGARVVCGEKTGFAYTDDIQLSTLIQISETAKSISAAKNEQRVTLQSVPSISRHYEAVNPIPALNSLDKIDLLRRIDAYARQKDPRIVQVMASINGVYEVILVAANDGTYASDIRPMVRLNITVIAEQNGRREQGSVGAGGRTRYERFLKPGAIESMADEAIRQALVNLESMPAPAGMFPVVLASGWPGVLLHEAVGHGLEGDFNRKGTSTFSGRLEQLVASPLCTVVDHGAMPDRRGSLSIDDEGTPTQETVLIENGILKNYLFDKLNARLMGMKPTGNARRESFSCLPMPRMTNTYMRAGASSPADIIASVERGVYAVNFGGGQVDITSGQFVFSANEAYWIENGKIKHPIKGATLIGSGPEVMNAISMVGNDLALDDGIGVCGKDGQSVPVGVGQPTLKVDQLTVGGTQA